MSKCEPPLPLELRVHGVGGPQAVKILGEASEHDVVTIPSFPVGNSSPPRRFPTNTETRFVQRLAGDRVEAYEWGGLTVASAIKALWVLYLPFTLINAAGWAHAADRPTGKARGRRTTRRSVRYHMRLTHLLAYLATIAYVAWIAYLTLDLAARAWVDSYRAGFTELKRPANLVDDLVLVWTPILAVVVCAGLVFALLWAPVWKGRFEEVRAGELDEHLDDPWPWVPTLADRRFFAHQGSHRRRLAGHRVAGVVAAAAAVGQYVLGFNQLGWALLVLAGAQVLALVALGIVETAGRNWRLPSEVFEAELMTEPVLDNTGSRMPSGTTFATFGTALIHAAFAGVALMLAPVLAGTSPAKKPAPLDVGPELGATDVLAWAVVLLVVFAIVIAVRSPTAAPEVTASGASRQGPIIRLARQVPRLGRAAVLAVALPIAVYTALNVRGILSQKSREFPARSSQWIDCSGRRIQCWYETYRVDESALARKLGSFVVLLIPGAVYGVLWRRHETGFGRVVGNVWDVLTFWPRRFHPYAVPCSAERSVPELGARIQYVMDHAAEGDRGRLVVVAHSQGAVLSAAAIAALPPDVPAPALVTFGCPLGTLYSPTWPAYIPLLCVTVATCVKEAHGRPWVNFWRRTDPVGAEVPCAENVPLPEPQAQEIGEFGPIRELRPLERPPQWGTVAGHGHYLAEPKVRAAVQARREPST